MTIDVFNDPGHGGSNSGAIRGTFIEKDVALSIATDCSEFISKFPFIVSSMSRVDDSTISYSDRAKRAKVIADLVICHHINAATVERKNDKGEVEIHDDESRRGAEIFVRHDDAIGGQVASQILRAMPEQLRAKRTRPWRTSQDGWLKNADSILEKYRPLPAILIEWGYVSNEFDREHLLDRRLRFGMSVAVLSGLAKFLEMTHSSENWLIF